MVTESTPARFARFRRALEVLAKRVAHLPSSGVASGNPSKARFPSPNAAHASRDPPVRRDASRSASVTSVSPSPRTSLVTFRRMGFVGGLSARHPAAVVEALAPALDCFVQSAEPSGTPRPAFPRFIGASHRWPTFSAACSRRRAASLRPQPGVSRVVLGRRDVPECVCHIARRLFVRRSRPWRWLRAAQRTAEAKSTLWIARVELRPSELGIRR